MKCSDVDRILPDLIDGVAVDESQDLEVQSHLRACAECSDLVADLKLIAREARSLSDCEEPPARVWVRIANELRAEGLIREHDAQFPRPVPVPARRRWNPLWLVPLTAAVLAAGSYLLVHHPSHHAVAQVTKSSPTQTAPQVAQQVSGQSSLAQQPAAPQPTSQRSQPSGQQLAKLHPAPQAVASSTHAAPDDTDEAELTPPITDNQFLSEVSTRAPGERVVYANELQAVNNEIRETKAYIARHPGDVDARQHLLEVYQQKVMLYQMALDRIQ